MASVRAALRALILLQNSPESILSLLGKTLHQDLQNGLFITMFFGSVDIRSHLLHFANAGHAPALHYSAKRNRFRTLDSTGMPLGVEDPPEYVTGPTIRLDVGDIVVLATDGIVEAMDPHGKQFGLARLKELVRKNLALPLERLVATIGDEVKAHYQAEAPADDLTVLAIRRRD
jgi:phosphoserine phosphatase RsbU/P